MSNHKWRDEAIRKSLRNMESRKQGMLMDNKGGSQKYRKRKKTEIENDGDELLDSPAITGGGSSKRKECRKKRFGRIMNELYEKMLNEVAA